MPAMLRKFRSPRQHLLKGTSITGSRSKKTLITVANAINAIHCRPLDGCEYHDSSRGIGPDVTMCPVEQPNAVVPQLPRTTTLTGQELLPFRTPSQMKQDMRDPASPSNVHVVVTTDGPSENVNNSLYEMTTNPSTTEKIDTNVTDAIRKAVQDALGNLTLKVVERCSDGVSNEESHVKVQVTDVHPKHESLTTVSPCPFLQQQPSNPHNIPPNNSIKVTLSSLAPASNLSTQTGQPQPGAVNPLAWQEQSAVSLAVQSMQMCPSPGWMTIAEPTAPTAATAPTASTLIPVLAGVMDGQDSKPQTTDLSRISTVVFAQGRYPFVMGSDKSSFGRRQAASHASLKPTGAASSAAPHIHRFKKGDIAIFKSRHGFPKVAQLGRNDKIVQLEAPIAASRKSPRNTSSGRYSRHGFPTMVGHQRSKTSKLSSSLSHGTNSDRFKTLSHRRHRQRHQKAGHRRDHRSFFTYSSSSSGSSSRGNRGSSSSSIRSYFSSYSRD